jgi:hypothetical protein
LDNNLQKKRRMSRIHKLFVKGEEKCCTLAINLLDKMTSVFLDAKLLFVMISTARNEKNKSKTRLGFRNSSLHLDPASNSQIMEPTDCSKNPTGPPTTFTASY